MLQAQLTGTLWRTAARLGLCLANVGDSELGRLRFKSLRWILVTAGGAAFLVVLAGGLAAVPAPARPPVPAARTGQAPTSGQARAPGHGTVHGTPPSRRSPGETLALLTYAAAAVVALAALAIWQWSRLMVRRALQDRAGHPIPCRGTVRWLTACREGGWPLLVRSERGQWLWLTGSGEALAPMRRHLARRERGRSWRVSVTLTYYPRSRVIHEVTGMAVEELEEVLAAARAYGASPA
jgi:hypothetical protein